MRLERAGSPPESTRPDLGTRPSRPDYTDPVTATGQPGPEAPGARGAQMTKATAREVQPGSAMCILGVWKAGIRKQHGPLHREEGPAREGA